MYTPEFENGFIYPLIKRLEALRGVKGRRVIALLAAPPAAGKSTLAAHIQKVSGGSIQALPMDGFHLKQEYLMNHMVMRDGMQISLTEIKGAPETFDAEGLLERVKRLSEGENIGFPVYNRNIHDTVDDALSVTSGIILIEGNYLLLDRPVWREIRKHADITLFIRVRPEDMLDRLIQRKLNAGRSFEYARNFALNSDIKNAYIVLNESAPADIEIRENADGIMSF